MDCKRIIRAIYLSFDDEMDAPGREALETHLAKCSPCARQRRFTGNFLVMFRSRTVRLEAPAGLRRRILEALPHRRQPGEAQ